MTSKAADVSVPAKTLRVRHEAALSELERYKILVDSVQDYAIFFMDPEGYIQTWNKGAQRIKGYKPEEIIGKHFSKFYLQDEVEAHKPTRILQLAVKLGRVEDEDWRVRKDGSRFWANVVITPLYDGDKQLIGFAKVTRDLTERKSQEDALRRANSQLKQQQQELERASVAKDEFISLASHQLRTPATAIKQLLGMLMEGIYGEVPLELLTVIEKAYVSNERQINIVNSLLKVAQVDAGKIIIRKAPADIIRMLRELADEYGETLNSRLQQLVLDLPLKTLTTLIDTENMRMAISNLIDNASKYTPDHGRITIGIRKEKNKAAVYITDNGIGIGNRDVAKLFGKFVRIPNELSQKVGGSGLGLYWVKQVVELHGGSIEVSSKIGRGTTFTIYLPLEKAMKDA